MKVLTQTVRKYYKYIYNSWTQPVLTSDGVMGGSEFAVTRDYTSYPTSYYAYFAFDSNTTSTQAVIQGDTDLKMYFPNPVSIESFTSLDVYTGRAPYLLKTGEIYVSDNGSTWTKVADIDNTSTANPWTVNIPSSAGYHKYWAIRDLTTYSVNSVWEPYNITINGAVERTSQESTSSDYDYYEDVNVYKALSNNNTYKVLTA